MGNEEGKRGVEDYLRVIYELYSKDGVKSMEIAKTLDITKASVSEMIKKLSKFGFVKTKPYSNIFLTKKGVGFAKKIKEKHENIKNLMIKIGHHNPNDESHKLEHVLSPEVIEKLNTFLEGKKTIIERIEVPCYVG